MRERLAGDPLESQACLTCRAGAHDPDARCGSGTRRAHPGRGRPGRSRCGAPHPEAPSTPQRTTGPNCSAHASSARCPSPETRKCSLETIPPHRSTTVAVSVRLCGSTPTTFPARSGVISVLDGPGPRRTCLPLLPIRVLLAVALRATVKGPVDNVPVGIDAPTDHVGKRSYQVRPVPESTDRGRHF